MVGIGRLKTSRSISQAISKINFWLNKLKDNGLNIDTRYDAGINVSLLKFNYQNKDYEFRSTKQDNCRLNMWAIARVIEYKVRSHIMNIEKFETSMSPYLQIENKSSYQSENFVKKTNENNYKILGIDLTSSNEEINKRYKELQKMYHPDRIADFSDTAKNDFQNKIAEINKAYSEIKQERGI